MNVYLVRFNWTDSEGNDQNDGQAVVRAPNDLAARTAFFNRGVGHRPFKNDAGQNLRDVQLLDTTSPTPDVLLAIVGGEDD